MYKFNDLESFLIERLPSGSGIDCNWDITIKNNMVICKNSAHVLNDMGYYMGYIPFTVKLPIVDNAIQCSNMKLIAHEWKTYLTKRYWPLYSDYIWDCVYNSLPAVIWYAPHNGMYSAHIISKIT